MNRHYLLLTIPSMLVLITSCATTQIDSTMDDVIAAGGEIVEFQDLIGDTGVTFVATDGGWVNHLGTDGKKIVKVKETGEIKELAWRINDQGQFCQQMFATGEEKCDQTLLVKDKDGVFNSYRKDKNNKPGLPFKTVPGNPENL